MFSYSTLLIIVGDVTVISGNSRSPEKGSSLKWQFSHTHSWALQVFFYDKDSFRVEHCKCTKLLQWIHINFLEFTCTVLLHSSQVDNGKRSDFGLVCWSSVCFRVLCQYQSVCSRAAVVIENRVFYDFLMVLFCINGVGFLVMMTLDCYFSSVFALKNSKYRTRIIQQALVIRFPMRLHK